MIVAPNFEIAQLNNRFRHRIFPFLAVNHKCQRKTPIFLEVRTLQKNYLSKVIHFGSSTLD